MRFWIVAVVLAALLAPAADAAPKALGKFYEWDALKDGARKTYHLGGLTLAFVATKPPKQRQEYEDGGNAAGVRITTPDGTAITEKFEGGFSYPEASFAVGRIDPNNPVPQVIVAAYSGGAHCCMQRIVFVYREGKWQVFHPAGGANWDDLRFPKDEDGDGVGDLILGDDRFAYAFCGFACSAMPPLVYTLKDGRLVDVSASGRYTRVYRAEWKEDREWCKAPDRGPNGGCAGFAVAGARLGIFRATWREVLRHYDRSDTWGWPDGCKDGQDSAVCKPGPGNRFHDYPEALASYLSKLKIITPAEVRWAVQESRKPEYQR